VPARTGAGDRRRRFPRNQIRKESPRSTVKLAARYTRYLLTSLATIAFGLNTN
jgi:hypothetical protein